MSTLRDTDLRHDPRARLERAREVDADARLLGATRGSRTGNCRSRRSRVALRRVGRGLPAEPLRAAHDDLVLRRDAALTADTDSSVSSVRDVVASRPRRRRSRRCRGRAPIRARTAAGASIVVIQLTSVPPPTPEPASIVIDASQVDEQAVVEVQARERIELVARHRRLVDERTGLEHDDRPTGLGQGGRDDASAGPRADDDDVGLERDRLVGRAARRTAARTAGSASGRR